MKMRSFKLGSLESKVAEDVADETQAEILAGDEDFEKEVALEEARQKQEALALLKSRMTETKRQLRKGCKVSYADGVVMISAEVGDSRLIMQTAPDVFAARTAAESADKFNRLVLFAE
jgi:hypothetical protein